MNADKPSTQRDSRDSVFLHAMVMDAGGDPLGTFRIRNISRSGLMAQGPVDFEEGDPLRIDLRNIGRISGHVVWAKDGAFGVAFDRTIDPKLARQPVSGRAS